MAVNCDADEIMAAGKSIVAHCNPQEDSLHHRNSTKTMALRTSDMPIPYPFTVEDSSPWSALEVLKKEANRVAMHSFPEDEHKIVVAMTSENTESGPSISSASLSREEDNKCDTEAEWDQELVTQAFGFVDKNIQTPKSDNIKTARAFDADPSLTAEINASFPSFSKCNSLTEASSGYLYPLKGRAQLVAATTISVSSFSKHDDEGLEHTVENFNQFLELSSMTDSFDHAIIMQNNGTRSSKDRAVPAESMDTEEVVTPSKEDWREGAVHKGLWPERLLKTPDMADAPSGILLVFDRMLDCIDPGGIRPMAATPKDEEYGYETDNSSVWSLSINRSWLLTEFDIGETDLSTTSLCSTSGDSLFGRYKERMPPLGAEWLDHSLDYIFPCWKEPPPMEDVSIRDLAQAVEVNRKRKWDCEDDPGAPVANVVTLELEIEEDDDESEARLGASGNDCDRDAGAVAEKVCSNDFGDDPFEFPPPEFPPPVWKKPDPSVVEADASNDNASGSSLSELFEGLVFGTPSDEKEEGDDDELQQILDGTSATEETSTLGYSDGSI